MVLSFVHLAGEALREAARRIEGANLAHPETKSGLRLYLFEYLQSHNAS